MKYALLAGVMTVGFAALISPAAAQHLQTTPATPAATTPAESQTSEGGATAGVTPDRLLAAGTEAEAGNWLMNHKTFDSNRFSPLDEINADNVKDLKMAFSVALGGLEPGAGGPGSMEGTPLADNGFLYVTDPWGEPYKIDVSSGKMGQIVWKCDTGIEKDPSYAFVLANRGAALWGNLVIVAQNDGKVTACDSDTGAVAWQVQEASDPGEAFTNAPLALPDKIIVGQSAGDQATRGWVAALDPNDGHEIWRHYTVPAPGEPGSETWKCDEAGNPDCWKTGGAAVWQTPSYDPDTDTLYVGTGNPVPMFDPEYRPGDNLYSDSSLAIDAKTGDMKWYFQYVPGDYFDYDAIGSQLLVNANIDGQDRKVLAHFGRNGFLYTLDRTNGSFIAATPYVDKITWTKGIDPKSGLPIGYDPDASLQAYAEGEAGPPRRDGRTAKACPDLQGGVNFWPTGYNPNTGIAYGAGIEGCSEHVTHGNDPADVHAGQSFLGGTIGRATPPAGSVFGYNLATGEKVAKGMTPIGNDSGVLVTPDLVFTGQMDGTFEARDAKTMDVLWSVNLGTSIKAPPMTYSVDGKQFVAILAGAGGAPFGHEELANIQATSMLYVFAL